MHLHPFSPGCGCSSCHWKDLQVALHELRDALVVLSLSVHDLQFECDQTRRKSCGAEVQRLLEEIALRRPLGEASRRPNFGD